MNELDDDDNDDNDESISGLSKSVPFPYMTANICDKYIISEGEGRVVGSKKERTAQLLTTDESAKAPVLD